MEKEKCIFFMDVLCCPFGQKQNMLQSPLLFEAARSETECGEVTD